MNPLRTLFSVVAALAATISAGYGALYAVERRRLAEQARKNIEADMEFLNEMHGDQKVYPVRSALGRLHHHYHKASGDPGTVIPVGSTPQVALSTLEVMLFALGGGMTQDQLDGEKEFHERILQGVLGRMRKMQAVVPDEPRIAAKDRAISSEAKVDSSSALENFEEAMERITKRERTPEDIAQFEADRKRLSAIHADRQRDGNPIVRIGDEQQTIRQQLIELKRLAARAVRYQAASLRDSDAAPERYVAPGHDARRRR